MIIYYDASSRVRLSENIGIIKCISVKSVIHVCVNMSIVPGICIFFGKSISVGGIGSGGISINVAGCCNSAYKHWPTIAIGEVMRLSNIRRWEIWSCKLIIAST